MSEKGADKQRFNRKSATDRRRELIAAGIACLGDGGMAGFTIDRICRQAGISRGLINHHFDGKDDLLASIYRDMTDHLLHEYPGLEGAALLRAIIDTSFDDSTFNRSNLRAWLAIWGQVSSNVALKQLHSERYDAYRKRIEQAIDQVARESGLTIDSASMARQLIALIDGLWLEYCLHSNSFSLSDARQDCYGFLETRGIDTEMAETA